MFRAVCVNANVVRTSLATIKASGETDSPLSVLSFPRTRIQLGAGLWTDPRIYFWARSSGLIAYFWGAKNVTWTGWKVGQRGTWWGSTRLSAGSCTWGGTNPCISTGLGQTCWRAALQRGTWVSWWMTSWPWASSVPWLPRKLMGSWDASRGVWPAGQGRFSFPSTLP